MFDEEVKLVVFVSYGYLVGVWYWGIDGSG